MQERWTSQPSQDTPGVTSGGGTVRLSWLIPVLRLIGGPGVHRIDHEARIHHANVTEAADVPVVAPSPRLVARRPSKCREVAVHGNPDPDPGARSAPFRRA